MGVPISQMLAVSGYVLGQKAAGKKRFPLVLMLEPLFRCNLACAGCGKIQYPAHVLKQHLSPGQCFKAAEECGAPMVSIPGGEPLLHPQIEEIVGGLVDRGKYVYLCTNALILHEKLSSFRPSKYFTINVHLASSRLRMPRCCLPLHPTGSAPRIVFSQLDTLPTSASVYAWLRPHDLFAQDSRSGWFATPFL